jgi:division protein CdvB (Snf7/Vps24/ESCRT-III family)
LRKLRSKLDAKAEQLMIDVPSLYQLDQKICQLAYEIALEQSKNNIETLEVFNSKVLKNKSISEIIEKESQLIEKKFSLTPEQTISKASKKSKKLPLREIKETEPAE